MAKAKTQTLLREKYRYIVCGMGIVMVLLLYLTWCFSTISYKGNIFRVIHLLCTLITMGMYVLCIFIVKRYGKAKKIIYQFQIINLLGLLAFSVITIADISNENSSFFCVLSDFSWIIGMIIACYFIPYQISDVLRKILLWLKKEWKLLILLLTAVVLAIYPIMLQFKWDGALYEQACRRMNIHSMSSMAAYSHLAQGYGVLYCMTQMIVGNSNYAMAVTNIAMYLASILAFYGIIKQLLPIAKEHIYMIGTSIYAFSPFTLGMINYYSLDYATLCLFMCMMYFTMKKEWVLQTVSAFLTCFTKEPAIVAYGGFCMGLVLVDLLKNKGTLGQRLKHLCCMPQYYFMILTAILWIITYKFLGGWTAGNGGFETEGTYIIEKCKVLYFLNFSWLFTFIIIIGCIVVFYKKLYKYYDLWWMLPVFGSMFLFTVFSVLFHTVNHARYTGAMPGLLYVCGIVLFCMILKNRCQEIFMSVVAVIMLLSSYRTIDPVSKLLFQELNTGNGRMITMGLPIPGDSMIYNKQMLDMEHAFGQAIGEAIKNDYMIILPTYDNNTNLFDGLMGTYEEVENCYIGIQYWNTEKECRSIYESDGAIPFEIYELKQEAVITEITNNEQGKNCFIYSELLGADIANQIKGTYESVNCNEYIYGAWKIYMLVF